jgi:helicase required for RNAi-mediated heterochromatin assembly 1
MIVSFVDYMILNGVDASKITLLTFYNGQRKRMNGEIYSHQNSHAFTGIKSVTVDGYQGILHPSSHKISFIAPFANFH